MSAIAAPNRCTECLSPNGFHCATCPIASWMTKYPFAIIGERGDVRARCQTLAEAEQFARTLVSANGGTTRVEARAARYATLPSAGVNKIASLTGAVV